MRNATPLLLMAAVVSCSSILTLADDTTAQRAPARPEIPSEDQLAAIRKEAKSFYEPEFKQLRTDSDRIELAQKLTKDGANTAGDDVAKYALLRLAQDLAIEAGDVDLTLDIADAIASDFAITDTRARSEALVRIADANKGLKREDRIILASEALERVDPLLDEKNIKLARRLATIAMDSARTARQFLLYRQAKEIDADLASIDEEHGRFLEAMRDHQKGKDIASTANTLGKFNCFVLNDWETGLEQLSDGGDAKLSDLARMTPLTERVGADAMVSIADRWWDFGDTLKGRRERVVKRFAASIYAKAVPELGGLDQKRAESRIAAAEKLTIEPAAVSSQDQTVAKSPARGRRHARAPAGEAQKYTAFGQVRLPDAEIQRFLDVCRAEKPQLLQQLKAMYDNRAPTMTPDELVKAREFIAFLSRDDVLIVPRCRRDGSVTKAALTAEPYGSAQTYQVLDKTSALVRLHQLGRVILDGVETTQMPGGSWQCYFLLKSTGMKRPLPGVFGKIDVPVYQALSGEGFPEDIVLW